MRSALAACLLILFLGGCFHWEKPGGTQAEFEAQKAACRARGFARFPPRRGQVASAGYTGPVQTDCMTIGDPYTASTSCTTTPSPAVGGVYGGYLAAQAAEDQNLEARNADWDACMYENGWAKVRNQ